jgi:serine/threonine-protein kinase
MKPAPHVDASRSNGLSAADQVDLVCDRFEDCWRHGEIPRIERFLEDCDPELREQLLSELLLVDFELRISHGLTSGREDYIKLYPAYSTQIEQIDVSTVADILQQKPLNPLQAIGVQLSHYRLEQVLGEGASGVVWRATDLQLRRQVAIKLPRHHTMTEFERARFRREGQACAQLRHSNIVAVFEVGEESGRQFIVSQLIDGCDLREWLIQHRPITFHEVIVLAAQIADALQHAHEQGVVHRDLKPANVLVDRAGKPYVTDFGLAKWTNQSVAMTMEGHLLGTPAYMSPEQARGDALSADQRSDVYSLGAMLYEMLTGSPPFAGEMASVIHKVVNDEPLAPTKRNAKIPRDLETICLTAMQKSPADRYQSMQALADDLRRYVRGEPILARRANLLKRGWLLVNRRKALTGMVVAGVAAAGSLGLAAMLAEKNRRLLGYRTVTINTDPSGARVAFIPLNPETAEPDMDRKVLAPGFSPVEVDLLPGDYFVVAVMEDGRFHEVYRHVPGEDDTPSADYNLRRFAELGDGRIKLANIDLPAADVTQGMTLVAGNEHFPFGFSGSRELPTYAVNMAAFWIDNHEFTWGQYKKQPQIQSEQNLLKRASEDNFALPARLELALEIAELLGKRLPTEAEYEYVATQEGTTKYPWGENWPKADSLESPEMAVGDPFGPVGSPDFDRVAMYPSVAGLCTNKAEWMMPQFLPSLAGVNSGGFLSLRQTRIFRGGSAATIAGDPRNTPEDRDPRQRNEARPLEYPGLGFRCVRSAEPRVKYEEFE